MTDYVNGTALPNMGTPTATDFHDLDMIIGRAAATAGWTANHGGFDNYSLVTAPGAPVPYPTPGLLSLGSFLLLRRRSVARSVA